jgi:hypothetical protein
VLLELMRGVGRKGGLQSGRYTMREQQASEA